MKKIAIIGTGIMGSGMAVNYLKQGYTVYVWNRSQEKMAPLIELGAIATESPKAATQLADMLFEVTANDASSRSVWLSDDGILSGATPNKTLIASATLSVSWIDELAATCKAKSFTFLDMPLTGGRDGAETGNLTLLAGGDQQQLERIKPDLVAISKQVLYFGPVGSGMRYKLILNMVQAIHITAFGEAMKIANQQGMNIQAVGDALAERPGGVSTNIAWRDYQTEPHPINFSVEWIAKDLGYATELGKSLDLPLLHNTLAKFTSAIEQGHAQDDWTKINTL